MRQAATTAVTLALAVTACLPSHPQPTTAHVTRIIDGDTIEAVTNGQTTTVRLLSYDAPEVGDCGSRAATRALANLIDGQAVTLERDDDPTGPYGRALRHVYVDGTHVNEAMVADGHGQVSIFQPNDDHVDVLRDAERQAREAKHGIWGYCTHTKGT